jgi:multidrug efflux pump subunit AcrB
VRELGLTAPQLASSLRAYVNGETATWWTTPDGDQVDVVLRLNQTQRERAGPTAWRCPWRLPRTARRSRWTAWPTSTPVFNPEVIRRQNLQRREAVFAGVQGRSAGDVGKTTCKS